MADFATSGFIWEIAPEFKALVVFAEHRYYGHSLPYGNKSFSEPRYSGYLTSQQALADYVDLISELTHSRNKNAVIAFGGSYGGMLAAYIRMKYPHIVQGAIAASAPIWQFPGLTPCNAYNQVLTSAYKIQNETCPQIVHASWKAINEMSLTDHYMSWLSTEWKLCKPLKKIEDVLALKVWLIDAYSNLAMANYPYPANFLADLPANPVKEFCSKLEAPLSPNADLLTGLFRGLSVYINNTGNTKCFNYDEFSPGLGLTGWEYQSCTEMVMPMCTDGVNDMFEPVEWDFLQIKADCLKTWKVQPDPTLAVKTYGGKNILGASNIIFSNGLLDPWSSGGVLKNLSKSLLSILIPEGAHHLDLRGAQPEDPVSVTRVRNLYREYISYWINTLAYKKNI